jgi:hypothetical protein
LSRAEQERYRSDAQQLCAFGLDVEIPEELQEDSRALDIHIAPPHENIIRQLPSGAVAYAIWVWIVALRAGVILRAFRLASALDQELLALYANGKSLYYFHRGFDFSEEEVLNHRIEGSLCFHHRGDLVEGWLLATGLKPIPEAYPDRMSVGVDVIFTDQLGHDHIAQAYAFTERSARYKAPTLQREKSLGLSVPSTSGVSASIGENKVSTPSCRFEGTAPAGAPVSRLRAQAPVEDFWDRSSS